MINVTIVWNKNNKKKQKFIYLNLAFIIGPFSIVVSMSHCGCADPSSSLGMGIFLLFSRLIYFFQLFTEFEKNIMTLMEILNTKSD